MLIEAIVALSFFGLILTAVAEAHHTISTLTKSASEREKRELKLLNEHYKDPSPLSKCYSTPIIPMVLKSTCCDLELSIDESIKTGRSCKLSPDAGSGLISFFIASLLLMLLASLSYPTIRQLLIERKEANISHSEKLSVAETESELERNLFDNQTIGLPGLTKIFPITHSIVKPVLELSNFKYSPHPNSSILSTTNINLTQLILPAQKSITNGSTVKFYSCGSLPNNKFLVAGIFIDHWDFFTVLTRHEMAFSNCNGNDFTLRKNFDENVQITGQLLGLAPIGQSELYYLDNDESIRRYSLVQGKTTPVDYGYSEFKVNLVENTFNFHLTKNHNQTKKDFEFDIELESANENSFFSLLF